jgi:hypothetical protein
LALKGRVCFDKRGRVVEVVGSGKRDKDVEKIPSWEAHFRRLWELRTGNDSSNYDPLRLITAVNLLKQLKKHEVLKLLDEYVRLTEVDEQFWIPLALRCVFRLPEKTNHPELDPNVPADAVDASGLPVRLRYPLLIVLDVPFVINAPLGGGGRSTTAEEAVAFYRTVGEIDKAEIRPPADLSKTRELILKSTVWKKLSDEKRVDKDEPPIEVLRQCVKLVRTAIKPNKIAANSHAADVTIEECFAAFEKQLAENPLEWSPLVGCYIRKGTQRYIAPAFVDPMPEIFIVDLPAGEVMLVLERVEPDVVLASLSVDIVQATVDQRIVVKLTTRDGRRRTLSREVPGNAGKVGSSCGEYFELESGAPVDVSIAVNEWVLFNRVVDVRD